MVSPLTSALDAAVKDLTENRDVAVAFSGGLDSGVVAVLTEKYVRSIVLYTVGVENSYDVKASEEMASQLDMEWVYIPIDEDSLIKKLSDSISITGTVDPVTLSFEVPLMYILPYVKQPYVIGGQGADEMLLGYSKYLDLSVEDVKKQRDIDFETLKKITLVHESKMAEFYEKTVCYPFLDSRVVDAVNLIGIENMLPRGDDRKLELRRTAEELGHPEIASKKKKAAQYGTGSMNLIKKMAKSRGISVSDFIMGMHIGGKRV